MACKLFEFVTDGVAEVVFQGETRGIAVVVAVVLVGLPVVVVAVAVVVEGLETCLMLIKVLSEV